jgi:DNA-binding SARP family transcriptional activator
VQTDGQNESSDVVVTDASCPRVRLQLLGAFLLTRADEVVPVARPAQRLVVLAALQGASRIQAARLLFPDSEESRALGRLRTMLWRLRQLCPELLADDAHAVRLGGQVVVDVRELAGWARLASRGAVLDSPFLSPGNWDLLPDFDDEWVLCQRVQLRELRIHALIDTCRNLRVAGLHGAALQAALVCAAEDPLRESAERAVIETYLAEGDLDAAWRHYCDYAKRLREELDIGPTPALARLLQGHGIPLSRSPALDATGLAADGRVNGAAHGVTRL